MKVRSVDVADRDLAVAVDVCAGKFIQSQFTLSLCLKVCSVDIADRDLAEFGNFDDRAGLVLDRAVLDADREIGGEQALIIRAPELERVDCAVLDEAAHLVRRAEADDLDLIRIPELARSFYPQTKYSAKVADKDKLAEWLREIGQDALITETVNSSTLAGFLKERLLEEGIDPPEEFVQLTTYKAIGSSKYAPK